MRGHTFIKTGATPGVTMHLDQLFDPSPRERATSELSPIVIVIEHADGLLRTDPNGMAIAAAEQELGKLRPTERPSVLSGQPAVGYRSGDIALALTPGELVRLVNLTLQPCEYFALVARYGMVYEWHEDFYAPDTGEALQPRSIAPGEAGSELEPPLPAAAWPAEPPVESSTPLALARFLVTHPLIAAGHWQLRSRAGEGVPSAMAGTLPPDDLAANVASLAGERECQQVLQAATRRPSRP